MCDAPNKAAKRLIKWRDSAQRQLSAASCSEDLSSALQFVLRNAAKALRAVLRSNDDVDRLSRDLNDVLCHVSSHLYVRSRDLLAGDCWSRFDYWEHQCAVLSYLLDLSLVREDPAAITKICFVLSKNKHMVWDVLVQTSAISSASEPQLSKLLELFRRFSAYCPRTCSSAELYLKFVVCAACLAKRLPGRGWKTVKSVVLSIEPVEFDFVEWFGSQPALIALVSESGVPAYRAKLIARLCKGTSEPAELLEACRRTLANSGGGCGGIRKTCDAEAAAEVDMFAIADEVPEREENTTIAEVKDEQLQEILDSTLSRIRSTIATPYASDAEPNSEINSTASNSPLNTKAFLDRLIRCSVADTSSGEVLKEVEFPTKNLDNGQEELVEEVNDREAEEVVEVTPAKGDAHFHVVPHLLAL
ncbi:hypothetical protein HPB50_019245 [Hyalomma asiaticum]|uniref:Uncharacterized protein n=1 Tax=Hyalomma asiaticum TaxID=266040 RepID=A0ACB7T9G6_HYAAI|nr:hypothetical protein HPB50_019245 [Hyalomma asiaticum]